MKKINKLACVLLICIFSFSVINFPVTAEEKIIVVLNGTELSFDVPPQIIDGRTMVPMRVIFEALEMDVEWVEETQTIYAQRDMKSRRIILQIDNVEMGIINREQDDSRPNVILVQPKQTIELDVPPMIVNGRTLVPVRAVAEAFDAEVEWIEESQTVVITKEVVTPILPIKVGDITEGDKGEEIDINDPEIQDLFNNILNGDSFISYYENYADVALLDNPINIIGGRMRELFSVLSLKDAPNKKYTDAEARDIIIQFLSKGEIDDESRLSRLKMEIERGETFGETAKEEQVIGIYKKNVIDEISINLFGIPLEKGESVAYSIAYASFFLYNRTNLLESFPISLPYNLYYNEASEEYLFTADLSMLSQRSMEDYLEYYNKHYEPLKSNTQLLRATRYNDEVSLYVHREAEFGEYSGGTGGYKGEYRNTYKKSKDGFYWVSSYGIDE